MQDYRNLKVWQKAHLLVLEIYQVTSRFPRSERFGLTAQLKRAAISVPSNIVEGSARDSAKEFLRFLRIAFGSCSEVEYQVFLAADLGYLSPRDYEKIYTQVGEVKRMLNGLIMAIQKDAL
jgi:four helix bundle protein